MAEKPQPKGKISATRRINRKGTFLVLSRTEKTDRLGFSSNVLYVIWKELQQAQPSLLGRVRGAASGGPHLEELEIRIPS